MFKVENMTEKVFRATFMLGVPIAVISVLWEYFGMTVPQAVISFVVMALVVHVAYTVLEFEDEYAEDRVTVYINLDNLRR